MTDEKIEDGLQLQHEIKHFALQERKLKEAIALFKDDMSDDGENGKQFHCHLQVLTKGIVKNHTSWSFNHIYWLEMLEPQLVIIQTKLVDLRRQFDAL